MNRPQTGFVVPDSPDDQISTQLTAAPKEGVLEYAAHQIDRNGTHVQEWLSGSTGTIFVAVAFAIILVKNLRATGLALNTTRCLVVVVVVDCVVVACESSIANAVALQFFQSHAIEYLPGYFVQIGRGPSTAAPAIGGQLVDFVAPFVGHEGSLGGTGIGGQDHARAAHCGRRRRRCCCCCCCSIRFGTRGVERGVCRSCFGYYY
mmetsp:Transcript_17947/g.37298  ORF Transcript_17947/g.37298 Transcript_17947/m.37298 type:complete len:205 (+) Transcript_17947:982-1596(+)